MATDVTYNGVKFHNVTTRQWSHETVFDESGTDAMFVRVRFKVEGILHTQGATGSGSAPSGIWAPAWIGLVNGSSVTIPADLSQGYASIRDRLWQQRKKLTVTMGGKTMLDVDPCTSETRLRDVNNGPKTHNFEIAHVCGSQVLKVTFDVEAALCPCPPDTACATKVPDVLSNRWSVSETIDDAWFTHRTIHGRLRLSRPNVTADAYRQMVLPVLEEGFRRRSFEWTQNATGLEVDYTLTDQQIVESAPYPALKMSGTHTESTQDGLTYVSAVQIRMEGAPGSSKPEMLAQAVRVAEAKLGDLTQVNIVKGKDDGILRILNNLQISETIGETNCVDIAISLRSVPKLDAKGMTKEVWQSLNLASIGKLDPLPAATGLAAWNPNHSMTPPAWGDRVSENYQHTKTPAASFLLACYLQSPCAGSHSIGGSGQASGGSPGQSGSSGSDPRYPREISGQKSDSANLPESPSASLSSGHASAPYNYCTEERKHHTIAGRLQLPLASKDPQDSQGKTCFVAQLCEPQARLEIVLDHERVGAMPNVPEPKDSFKIGEVEATLLKTWLRTQPPNPLPGSTGAVYRVGAFYLYALSRPLKPTEEIYLGRLPATSYSKEQLSVRQSDLHSPNMAVDSQGSNTGSSGGTGSTEPEKATPPPLDRGGLIAAAAADTDPNALLADAQAAGTAN